MKTILAGAEARLQRHRFGLLWLGCAGVILTMWARVYGRGEVPYFLTDFLINYADGFVRRGLAGQFGLMLTDRLGGSPMFWALVLASAVCAASFGLVIRFYGALPDDPALLPLILAPFGLGFLAYDPDGSIRKEVFGYLALILVLLATTTRASRAARLWSVAGVLVFLVSIFNHEVVIFLWPSLAAALWLVQSAHPDLRRWTTGLAAASLVTGAASVLWLSLLPAPDPQVICAAAGLSPCSGAIPWLTSDPGQGIAYVIERRAWADLPIFAAYALLCLLPFRGLRWSGRPVWIGAAVTAVPLLAVAPLFLLGYDWGRWLHMAFFPLSLLCLTAIIVGKAEMDRPLRPALVLPYIGTWSIPHAVATLNYTALLVWPALAVLIVLRRIRPLSVKTR